eukprot:1245319-Lingulodinium_polyedra.AAC.1
MTAALRSPNAMASGSATSCARMPSISLGRSPRRCCSSMPSPKRGIPSALKATARSSARFQGSGKRCATGAATA